MNDITAISCTVPELHALLDVHLNALRGDPTAAAEVPPLMLWGPPGVGKSSAVRQAASRHGIGLLDIRLAQREPVDLRGLPVPRGDAMDWLLPSEWPRDPTSRGIILFDELTAADRSLQVAAYELILDRRLGTLYTIPPGWYVMAAGNRACDRAVSGPMSSALANRFCHLEIVTDVNAWAAWAVKEGLRPDVIGFLRARPGLLFEMPFSSDLSGRTVTGSPSPERGWPSPRSWARVSFELDLLDRSAVPAAMRDRLEGLVVAGLVGQGVALEFQAFRQMACRLPDVQAMLEGREAVVIPDKADQRFAFCAAVVHHMQRRSDWMSLLPGFFAVGLALPSDFAAFTMVDLLQGRSAADAATVVGHTGFPAWSKRHGTAILAGSGGIAADLGAELGAELAEAADTVALELA